MFKPRKRIDTRTKARPVERDTGRTAMLFCFALAGLLRQKGVVADEELASLAASLDRDAVHEEPDVEADMRRAAQWFRYAIPSTEG